MSNEPAWAFVNNINIAAYTLANKETLYSKDYIIGELSKKYVEIEKLNKKLYEEYTELGESLQNLSKKNEFINMHITIHTKKRGEILCADPPRREKNAMVGC